ncbi:hypothetical protein CSOJ01_07173 [Colletotrichum sojae]|uniref:Uncharacterized protein n=1 Tax=Colletotrichum sojae TaxID=2175907 RepID=A0A8H6J9S7_9PEZI|nr:hypothetical protein CSOJ01_07173 [Colletotrichum sojae]
MFYADKTASTQTPILARRSSSRGFPIICRGGNRGEAALDSLLPALAPKSTSPSAAFLTLLPVSRLDATATLSADLASPETATLPKLRLAGHQVRQAWDCWASEPFCPSFTPGADSRRVGIPIPFSLHSLGQHRSVHICHPESLNAALDLLAG